MKKLNVALTFDTDDDMFDPSFLADSICHNTSPTFSSFLDHAEEIRDTVQDVLCAFDKVIPLTWFVRCDDEILHHYGEAEYLVNKKSIFLNDEIQSGSQVGFHPHLYKIDLYGNRSRKISDFELCDQFERNTHAFYNAFPDEKKIVRIGEAFACNALFERIEKLKFEADASAMPGRYRKDQYRSLDWLGTPYRPYNPSIKDYRIASNSTFDRRSFVEIPFTMLKLKCYYDTQPISRYVDLSFHHQLIRRQLENLDVNAEYLMTMTHPAGIFPKYKMRDHGLVGFGLDNFRKNLFNLVRFSNEKKIEINFVTVSDLGNACN